jgi:DNA-binding NtrC family response regulator
MDGVEVLRQIKAANAACIVVMMSAYHMVDRAVEAMETGRPRLSHQAVSPDRPDGYTETGF